MAMSGGSRHFPGTQFLHMAKQFGACQVVEKPIDLNILRQLVAAERVRALLMDRVSTGIAAWSNAGAGWIRSATMATVRSRAR